MEACDCRSASHRTWSDRTGQVVFSYTTCALNQHRTAATSYHLTMVHPACTPAPARLARMMCSSVGADLSSDLCRPLLPGILAVCAPTMFTHCSPDFSYVVLNGLYLVSAQITRSSSDSLHMSPSLTPPSSALLCCVAV